MNEGPSDDLQSLLAQAQQKITEKGQADAVAAKQSTEGDLEKHEGAITEEKKAASESTAMSARVTAAREKVQFGEKDIAAIDEKADMLRAAGMEEQLNALFAQKRKILEERQQLLAEAEAALGASEGQVVSAQDTAAEIVPPTMAETVTPAQNEARGALEKEAYNMAIDQAGTTEDIGRLIGSTVGYNLENFLIKKFQESGFPQDPMHKAYAQNGAREFWRTVVVPALNAPGLKGRDVIEIIKNKMRNNLKNYIEATSSLPGGKAAREVTRAAAGEEMISSVFIGNVEDMVKKRLKLPKEK